MKTILSSQQLPENASVEIIGRAYHATETFVEVVTLADSHMPLVGFSGLLLEGFFLLFGLAFPLLADIELLNSARILEQSPNAFTVVSAGIALC